jgi:cyclopropane fatty-acyl-phospholipid synthase-like methyltransferase
MDPKRLVEQSYDSIADRYLELSATDELRMERVSRLTERLSDGAAVLELGCGAGVPVARALAERYSVTGVDISGSQVERARANVPGAQFIQADMTEVRFPAGAFDAIVGLYCLIHVPREQHAGLLLRMKEWTKPGGYLLINMGTGDDPGTVEDDWLGSPMFFSSFDAEANRRLVEQAGFDVIEADVVPQHEDGRRVTFLWILAQA